MPRIAKELSDAAVRRMKRATRQSGPDAGKPRAALRPDSDPRFAPGHRSAPASRMKWQSSPWRVSALTPHVPLSTSASVPSEDDRPDA